MKVDLSGAAAAQLLAERNVKPVTNASVESAPAATADRTTFHSDKAVQSLATQALQSPEVRQPVVDTLRQSVSSGSYRADASQTATAIISHES